LGSTVAWREVLLLWLYKFCLRDQVATLFRGIAQLKSRQLLNGRCSQTHGMLRVTEVAQTVESFALQLVARCVSNASLQCRKFGVSLFSNITSLALVHDEYSNGFAVVAKSNGTTPTLEVPVCTKWLSLQYLGTWMDEVNLIRMLGTGSHAHCALMQQAAPTLQQLIGRGRLSMCSCQELWKTLLITEDSEMRSEVAKVLMMEAPLFSGLSQPLNQQNAIPAQQLELLGRLGLEHFNGLLAASMAVTDSVQECRAQLPELPWSKTSDFCDYAQVIDHQTTLRTIVRVLSAIAVRSAHIATDIREAGLYDELTWSIIHHLLEVYLSPPSLQDQIRTMHGEAIAHFFDGITQFVAPCSDSDFCLTHIHKSLVHDLT